MVHNKVRNGNPFLFRKFLGEGTYGWCSLVFSFGGQILKGSNEYTKISKGYYALKEFKFKKLSERTLRLINNFHEAENNDRPRLPFPTSPSLTQLREQKNNVVSNSQVGFKLIKEDEDYPGGIPKI